GVGRRPGVWGRPWGAGPINAGRPAQTPRRRLLRTSGRRNSETGMSVTPISRKAATSAARKSATPAARPAAAKSALEIAAVTRLLENRGILDYSGHVSARIPGRDDASVIHIASTSRAELAPENILVVSYDGRVLEGDGTPPSELPIHTEILKARPDVQAVLHSHMEIAIAFTMMEGVKLMPMRARASRWKS